MPLNRIRAKLRFTNSSGMAAWCQANMGVRHGQAVHINEGLANEESKKNEVVADGASHSIYSCDLPLMNEAHAIDAYSTLMAIMAWVQPFASAEDGVNFLERHTCYHDEETPQQCIINQRHEK